VHLVHLAPPPSQVGIDLRACLTALGTGPEVLGGMALLGLTLPGLDVAIDAVLVLPHGVFVAFGVDLPGPAVRLEAPLDGPWLVDGWRLVRPDGAINPVGHVLAAVNAVAARLEVPGAPELTVHAVVIVGPYVQTVVQPRDDLDRGVRVLPPTGRSLLGLTAELCNGAAPCGATAAAGLLRVLVPRLGPPPHAILTAEGFG
jgi:hypothetical protein